MSINAGMMDAIWAQAYSTIQWWTAQPYVDPVTTAQQADLVYNTMTAGAKMVTVLQLINALTTYSANLQSIQLLPVTLGTASAALTTRLAAAEFLQFSFTTLLPAVPGSAASALLSAGQPALTTVDYLSPLTGVIVEPYSAGITQNLTDWQSIQSQLISYYGNQPTNLLDTANYTVSSSIMQTGLLASIGVSSGLTGVPYNQLYAIPVCFLVSNIYNAALFDPSIQQSMVLLHNLRAFARNVAIVLLAADAPSPTTQITTTLSQGNESLQDIANRTLSDFEDWTTLSTINNIPAGTDVAPGTALLVPPVSLPSGVSYTYNVNVLGRDINLGPTSGMMPAWTGDFSTISGPDNLLYALGRRLLTTVGTFIYHPDYGSRIPPEVGAVQSVGTMQHIAAFGVSCLQSDPRVAQVFNAGVTGSTSTNYGLVSFQATVQPVGPQSNPVQVNQVIGPG